MRLTRVQVTNFGCYQDRVFDLTRPKTFLLGLNNSGKSTVLDAIRWLLLGRCAGLDRAGRGIAEALVRQGTPDDQPMTVAANIVLGDKSYLLTRTWAHGSTTFSVGGPHAFAGPSEGQHQGWLSILGISEAALEATLDAETFLTANHADAKGLLLGVLAASVTVPTTGEVIPVEEADRRYTAAYEARTSLGRSLKALPAAIEPSEPVGDLDGVKAKVQALEVERLKLTEARGEATGLSERAWAEFDQLEKDQTRLKARRAGLVKDIPAEALADLPAAIATVEERVGLATAKIVELERQLDAARESTYVAGNTPDDVLETIAKHDPKKGCVLHPDIECKTSLTQFVTFVKKAKRGQAAPEGEGTSSPFDVLKLALADARKHEVTLDRQRVSLVDAQQGVQVIDEDLDSIISRLDELAPTLPERGIPDGIKKLDADIAALTERIEKGKALTLKKQLLATAWKTYETAVTTRAEIKAQHEQAEADVKIYGPTGIRLKALQEAVGTFEAGVNKTLVIFGYEFAVSADPWGVLVNGRPLARLSKSERLRVGIAFQIAMAKHTGLDVTLIDSVDWLLKDQRRALMKALSTAGLGQVILAKAQEPGDEMKIDEAATQVIQI